VIYHRQWFIRHSSRGWSKGR